MVLNQRDEVLSAHALAHIARFGSSSRTFDTQLFCFFLEDFTHEGGMFRWVRPSPKPGKLDHES